MKNHIIVLAGLVVGLVLLAPVFAAESAFSFPESNLSVEGRVTLLAIDDQGLRDRENLTLTLSKPKVRKEPVLTPEQGNPNAPDSMAAHFYGTVLHNKGKFQMWYYAVSHVEGHEQDLKQGPVCYAESDDGLHWTKPKLGQVEINGSKENNGIYLPDPITQVAMVIIDEEEPDPARRYKMLYTAKTHTWVFRPAFSADGIEWTVPEGYPTDKFMESGSLFKFGDRWIVHGQGIGRNDQGVEEGRQGYASTSPDFKTWDVPYHQAFRLPEPEDVAMRGLLADYPQVHLGVGAASFGNVAVGLYGAWHNPALDKQNKTGWYGAGLITCDFGLVVSNDGVAFREPVTNHVFIAQQESPAIPAPGTSDPTILCQANGILNVDDETLIYHGRWRNATDTAKNYYGEIGLATLPRDRWGSLSVAEGSGNGTVWSAPITLPTEAVELSLNADGAKNITVELADESGTLLPDFSGENSGEVKGSKANVSQVKWKGEGLTALAGKTVRLKLGLKGEKTGLYAVYLDPAK
jgi:hypothetical protein